MFDILLRLGRLSFHSLLPHVRLPARQLRNALAVLIQQHLVLHYSSPEDSTTYYEADWESAFSLVRLGKVIELAGERFGETAAEVTSNLLLQGHAAIGDLVVAYSKAFKEIQVLSSVRVGKGGNTLANGSADQNHATMSQELNTILTELLDCGYVIRVRAEHFRPMADNFNEAEHRFKSDRGNAGVSGTKAKLELKGKINRQVRTWRDGYDSEEGQMRGTKRSHNFQAGSYQAAKRVKIGHHQTNGLNGHGYSEADDDDADLLPLDPALVVRVNHEKYVVALRNRELINLAKHKTGTTTAVVYAEFLRRVESSISRCHDPLDDPEDKIDPNLAAGPTVSTLELAVSLSHGIDLSADIAPHSGIQTQKPPKNRPKQTSHLEPEVHCEANSDEESEHSDSPHPDDDYIDENSFSSARRARLEDVKKHLQLLCETSPPLLIQTGTRGLGEFAVPFDNLIRDVRLTELEHLILSRFGPCALRLTRILAERGSKLDEKTISNLALVKQKEIRVTLTAMHEAGFLDLQEVPRDNSRAPSRTIYLWYYDPERVRLLVLEDVYKGMARTLQRARTERGALRELLAKAERSDVKGNEETFLSKGERMALRNWGEKEERLLVQLGRLERLVGVFRDF